LTSKYDRYSKEKLIKIIEERDRKPRLGLVWERDEIDHDRSLNQDSWPWTCRRSIPAATALGTTC
jgi:hypothetical protein